jgi:GNAT superfamily N-acetyltransferase
VSDVRVREADAGDLEQLVGLYAELMDGDRPGAQPSDAVASLPAMAAILADPARHLLVATIAAEVLGTVDLLIAPNLTHHCEPWGIVENVVVAGRARRKGIGRALMLRAIEIAQGAGCYKVQLMSGLERGPAHEFYRDIGMEPRAQGFKIYLDGSMAGLGG